MFDRDPILKRPTIMDNLEVTSMTYAYEISKEDMEYIITRDSEQVSLGRKVLMDLLVEHTDASSAGYFDIGHHIYFDLSARHWSYENLQEVIDHVNMYIEGLECRWIVGD